MTRSEGSGKKTKGGLEKEDWARPLHGGGVQMLAHRNRHRNTRKPDLSQILVLYHLEVNKDNNKPLQQPLIRPRWPKRYYFYFRFTQNQRTTNAITNQTLNTNVVSGPVSGMSVVAG